MIKTFLIYKSSVYRGEKIVRNLTNLWLIMGEKIVRNFFNFVNKWGKNSRKFCEPAVSKIFRHDFSWVGKIKSP